MRTKLLIVLLIGFLVAGCLVQETPTAAETPVSGDSERYAVNVFLNEDYHFPPHHKDGNDADKLVITGLERAAFLDALSKGREEFSADGHNYRIVLISEGNYQIIRLIPKAEVLMGKVMLYPDSQAEPEQIQEAYDQALAEDRKTFELDAVYYISDESKPVLISLNGPSLMATQGNVEPYNPDNAEITATYQFRYGLERAIALNERTFSFLGKSYSIVSVPGGVTVLDREGDLFAELSRYYVVAASGSVEPPLVFKNKVREAVVEGLESFIYTDANGVETEYAVVPNANGRVWSVAPK